MLCIFFIYNKYVSVASFGQVNGQKRLSSAGCVRMGFRCVLIALVVETTTFFSRKAILENLTDTAVYEQLLSNMTEPHDAMLTCFKSEYFANARVVD